MESFYELFIKDPFPTVSLRTDKVEILIFTGRVIYDDLITPPARIYSFLLWSGGEVNFTQSDSNEWSPSPLSPGWDKTAPRWYTDTHPDLC